MRFREVSPGPQTDVDKSGNLSAADADSQKQPHSAARLSRRWNTS